MSAAVEAISVECDAGSADHMDVVIKSAKDVHKAINA